MKSRYIKECKRLMQLSQKELAELYKRRGFGYCGKSKRRKLRMAARLAVYKYGPRLELKAAKKKAEDAINFIIKSGMI